MLGYYHDTFLFEKWCFRCILKGMLRFYRFLFIFIFGSLLTVSAEEMPLFHAVNAIRAEAGVPACGVDPAAERAAALYAKKILEADRFSHTDEQGRNGIDRYRDAGGNALKVGEVIGTGPDLESVINAWKQSRDHKTVITNHNWTGLGAGAAERPAGGVLAVLLFTRHVFVDISIQKLPGEGGIVISGTYTGEGVPAVVINGTLAELETAGPDGSGAFECSSAEEHAVYFIRFGTVEADGFSAAESLIFEPGSS
jgi:hypothetical protein